MKIAVFGAGSIGCWVGGRLAAGSARVTLIGRARAMDELAGGLRVSDLDGREDRVTVTTATDVAAAEGADYILVTVKSAATGDAARALASAGGGATIVSLQNGVRNVAVLRAGLPGRRVLAGMVPFNVVRRGAGSYHRASQGELKLEAGPAGDGLIAMCRAANLAIASHADMPAVQWAKLVMNLNNAINALSGRPLAEELSHRHYRRCLAAAQREALDLIAAAGHAVATLTAVPARWMPRLLESPDAVFGRLAKRVIAIDPHARSSMWDDLEAGRPTEIDYIQGEIVTLAEQLRRRAPVNAKLVSLIRTAEAGGKRDWDGAALISELRSAAS